MPYSFKAKIYKAGINPCVDVQKNITGKMNPVKGYIPVKGQIQNYFFKQTLVPVKNALYRLYVNEAMLKGSNSKVGESVKFSIVQDFEPRKISMPPQLKKKLDEYNLYTLFSHLTLTRQKEILNYLNYLKTDKALERNIDKVIDQLKKIRHEKK